MMSLDEARRAIRPLLNPNQPRDAMEDYFAYYHSEGRTRLVAWPEGAAVAAGYVAVSRTGMDLFRPLVTLRLPPQDMGGAADMIYHALAPGTAVFLSAPEAYFPLVQALFDIETEEHLAIFSLDPQQFKPVINVLVTHSHGPYDLPRYAIRSEAANQEVVASAHLNWQSPRFAEIGVNVQPQFRRRGFGRSVVAAMAQHLLDNGRIPLYAVAADNTPSILLAQSIGFTDTGARTFMLQATLRPRP